MKITEFTPEQLRNAERFAVITAEGVNITVSSILGREKCIIRWLHKEKTVEYDDARHKLRIYPVVVMVHRTTILIGDYYNLNQPVECDFNSSKDAYIYVKYVPTINHDPAVIEIYDEEKKSDDYLLIARYIASLKKVIPEKALQLGNASHTTGSCYLIKTPEIINPKSDGDVLNDEIESSKFETLDCFYGTHDSSDWEIATDQDFSNIVESSYNDAQHLTKYRPSKLSYDSLYYVRVRYRSDYHTSEWSQPRLFKTPEKPTCIITSPNVQCETCNTPYPTFKITNTFQSTCSEEKWKSTQWQIATDNNFQHIVYSKEKTDEAYRLHIDDDSLEPNQTYYVRARFIADTNNMSEWSDPLQFQSGKYVIDDVVNDEVEDKTTYEWKVTHDGGRSFDLSKYTIHVDVNQGTATIENDILRWATPDVNGDTEAIVKLWATNTNGDTVSKIYEKHVIIKDSSLIADDSIIVTDFSDYEENDGWSTS